MKFPTHVYAYCELKHAFLLSAVVVFSNQFFLKILSKLSHSLDSHWVRYFVKPSPEVIKLFFILNSNEHELFTAYKIKIQTNEEVYCCNSLSCCVYHANKC